MSSQTLIEIDAATLNLERVLASYRGKETDVQIMPTTYVIEPTNYCNIDCVMCPNHNFKANTLLPFNLFTRIVDEAADYAEAFLLYFVGEPLIHHDIIQMIEYCKRVSHANVFLSTNATLLTGPITEQLIGSGLDYIIFGIDGNTKETFETIRRGAKFSVVLDNVTGFIDRARLLPKPKVIVQLINQKDNMSEIDKFKEFWSDYDCTVSVAPIATWAGQMPELSLQSGSLFPDPSEVRMQCADLWFKMVINSKGKVVLCCQDWASSNILGDLTSNGIHAIWNNDRITQLRRQHLAGKFNSISMCRSCNEWSREEDEYGYIVDVESFQRRRP